MTTTEILDRSEEAITPEMAIIVHKIGHRGYYLERRDIIKGKMAAGVPLTEDCLIDMVNTFSSDRKDIVHGVLPDNMLYADCRRGYNRYVWWRGPERRQAYFKSNLNIPNGQIWTPGLIYSTCGGTLSVHAFKGRKPKSKLFRAPFFNVYDSNDVCLGGARVGKPDDLTYEAIIQYWEDMFWKSEFAHTISDNPIKGNLSTLTKRLIETGERFPESELKPIETTLNSLLK